MKTESYPKTQLQAISYFSDPDIAHEFMVHMRWPEGVTCPLCRSDDVKFVKTKEKNPRRLWNCHRCKKQFTVKVGTIFEDSPIGCEKWLPAIWLTVNCKNGISSCELARSLGVTQKTAWFMLHRIRHSLQCGLKGTYVHVNPEHLFRYVDEQAYRFNERKGNDSERFVEATRSVVGRRLTYKELAGRN